MSQPLTAKRLVARTVALGAYLLGLTTWLRQRRRRRRDFRVFILEYHGVDPEGGEWEGTISQARFRRHLSWLKRHFTFATVSQAAEHLKSGSLEQDLLVVTFDDGYANNVEGAWPVLRELDLPATIYLTTSFLDGEVLWFDLARRALTAAAQSGGAATSPEVTERLASKLGGWPSSLGLEESMRRLKRLPSEERLDLVKDLGNAGLRLTPAARSMTWEQAKALRDGGIELGAHTVSHPILSRQNPGEQRREILQSRDRLHEQLGSAPTSFAMPNGGRDDYDEHTLEALREAGFLAACTTRRGSNAPGCELLELRRLGVGSDPVPMLAARLSGLFDEGIRRLLPF